MRTIAPGIAWTLSVAVFIACIARAGDAQAWEDYGSTVTHELSAQDLLQVGVGPVYGSNPYGYLRSIEYRKRRYCLDNLVDTVDTLRVELSDGTALPIADIDRDDNLKFVHGVTRLATVASMAGSQDKEGLSLDIEYLAASPYTGTRLHLFLRPCIAKGW